MEPTPIDAPEPIPAPTAPEPDPAEAPAPAPESAAPAPVPLRRRVLAVLVETVQTLLLAALFYAAINITTVRVVVDGPSMRPTLKSGEWVVVNRMAYKLGAPQRGDVVVILPPTSGQTDDLIKRVIGLPNQTVEVRDGRVFIDGEAIEEPYANGRTSLAGTWTLGANELFLMGDNRAVSLDSRSFGPVTLEMVVGKAEMIYWPPSEWGPISWRVASGAHAPDSPTLGARPTQTPAGYPYPAVGPIVTPVVGGYPYPAPGLVLTPLAVPGNAGYPYP